MAEVDLESLKYLGIMSIGILIAVFAAIGTRPVKKVSGAMPPLDLPGPIQNDRDAEIWQFQPRDEMEHLEALELHLNDPIRNPAPSPPPRKTQEDFS